MSSPNTCEISGEVVKSPPAPNTSRCAQQGPHRIVYEYRYTVNSSTHRIVYRYTVNSSTHRIVYRYTVNSSTWQDNRVSHTSTVRAAGHTPHSVPVHSQ
jgi:hypothetical protein